MNALEAIGVKCPYCGAAIVMTADASAGTQEYIEDCSICCKPINVRSEVNERNIRLSLSTDDE